MRLELTRKWNVGERIGGGGFGQVYAARSDDTAAVAKLVPKEPGADRELLFVDLAGVRNVVPVIDSGETEDHWVLVMPRAEKSLHQHIADAGGSLDVAETVSILSDIAEALADLEGRVVHRDLKPANVLFLNGHWCLADFGISRYAEATTAPDTQKYALSPPYAAPERWRNERATSATDVYAVGVMAFELLSGSRPFPGPSREDYREQHLYTDPPRVDDVSAPFASLVEECLYKASGARPSPVNLLARLMRLAEPAAVSSGLSRLQEANHAEVSRRGEVVRRESELRSSSESRAALIDAARSGFTSIAAALKEALTGAAPSIIVQVGRDERWSLYLNQATLRLAPMVATSPSSSDTWRVPFNVIAHSSLSLSIPPDRFEYEGRSHSLWYCDAREADHYQWFETAFMISAFIPRRGRQNPFALDPGEESAKALWAGVAEFQVAWPFTALHIGGLDEFIDRWGSWFADAAQGQLVHPSSIPERPVGGWRR
jgi:eukaryotic-like serine/threonine-protein kinase